VIASSPNSAHKRATYLAANLLNHEAGSGIETTVGTFWRSLEGIDAAADREAASPPHRLPLFSPATSARSCIYELAFANIPFAPRYG
jgi:hypothetical protein